MKKKIYKRLLKFSEIKEKYAEFRNDIVKELKLLKITEKIMINSELSYKNEIFSLSDYKKSQNYYNILTNYCLIIQNNFLLNI